MLLASKAKEQVFFFIIYIVNTGVESKSQNAMQLYDKVVPVYSRNSARSVTDIQVDECDVRAKSHKTSTHYQVQLSRTLLLLIKVKFKKKNALMLLMLNAIR